MNGSSAGEPKEPGAAVQPEAAVQCLWNDIQACAFGLLRVEDQGWPVVGKAYWLQSDGEGQEQVLFQGLFQ